MKNNTTNTIDLALLSTVHGGMGRGAGGTQPRPAQPAPTQPRPAPTRPAPTRPAPQQPQGNTPLGDMCREGYTGVGGAAGAVITSESGGWGAIPGAMIGAGVGNLVCPN